MNIFFVIGEVLFIGFILLAIVLGGNLTHFIDIPSVLIVAGGCFSMALMSFTISEIASAFLHAFGVPGNKEELELSSYFWECMIRNLLLVGVLGTAIGLVQMLAYLSDPNAIGPSVAVAILTTLYGIIVAAIFPLPAYIMIKKRIAIEFE